ncbi:hypothetical protein [Paenibacillus segetis]|uniref:Uncharacterized protein n=1 Tax=Paenibacillus segetis TaxID=1325360 RepID=A0ABQ1YE81_9BACL|nr:hypothetical protein [Paenibacillus segetis]GGH21283.1 hypothetical protein GCM10008013_19110 [Paenibacillus segetis]
MIEQIKKQLAANKDVVYQNFLIHGHPLVLIYKDSIINVHPMQERIAYVIIKESVLEQLRCLKEGLEFYRMVHH